MSNKNPNCDGSHCRSLTGEVRVYPLGGGGNLILCHACWAHENRYRFNRAREYGYSAEEMKREWPQHDWQNAEVYEGAL